jgi:hypothetical protein
MDELDLSQMNEKEKKKTIAQRLVEAEKAKKRLEKEATRPSEKSKKGALSHRRKEIDDRASHLLKKLPLATKTLPTHL